MNSKINDFGAADDFGEMTQESKKVSVIKSEQKIDDITKKVKVEIADDPVMLTVSIQIRKSRYQAIQVLLKAESDRINKNISITSFINKLIDKKIKGVSDV
jgi:hypothetical protein